MIGGTLFIQPHSDDIAMSSYYILKARVLPMPYYLLTVFSKSTWIDPIRRVQLFRDIIRDSEVTRIRTEEDKRFSKLLGLRFLSFDHEDCLLRTGTTILSPKKPIDLQYVSTVACKIANVIKYHSIRNILTHFPSGRQQHIDHRLVFHAACSVKEQLPINLYLVDDFPYSRVKDPKRNGLRVLDEIVATNLEEKFAAMNIYTSQMCDLFFLQVAKLTDQNRGSERLLVFG